MKKTLISIGASALIASTIVGVSAITVKADSDLSTGEISKEDDGSKEIAHGRDEVDSDDLDSGIPWSLTEDGTLHIQSGNIINGGSRFAWGSMDDDKHALVKKVVFEGKVVAKEKTSNFFGAFPNLEEIDNLKNFDTSNTTDMSQMFAGLKNLKTVDLSQLNTENVTDMSNMFKGTSNLKNIDIPNWDVKNVKNITSIFYESGIENLNISNWKLESLNSTSRMFFMVPNLKSINMFKDFYGITNTSYMFMGTGIEDLDASDWKMDSVTNMQGMFAGMTSLKNIDVSNWIFPNTGVDMTALFSSDSSLEKLDLSTWNNKDNNVEGYLAETGIKQITVSDTTALADSYLGVKFDDEGENPTYGGYWQKGDDLIKAIDFVNGQEYSGTYNYISPDDVIGNVTIKTSQGEQTVKNVIVYSEDINDEFDIKVPEIAGYTANKTTVKAKVVTTTGTDGKPSYSIEIVNPTTDGYVTYTKDNDGGNNNSGGSTSKPKPDVTKVKRLVTTHADNPAATLYKKDGTVVSNRALASNSSWFSDQQMTKNGETYYRVASNEWVKASAVYPYEDYKLVIRTGSESYQRLTTSKGKDVSNRALAVNTAWKVDKLAHINGQDYYRVATNEFVPVNEVTVE